MEEVEGRGKRQEKENKLSRKKTLKEIMVKNPLQPMTYFISTQKYLIIYFPQRLFSLLPLPDK